MEANIDVQTINVPNLIRMDKYYQLVSTIKNYEDTLQKIFSSGKDSSITSDPFTFLWKINKDGDNSDMFPELKNIDLDSFGISLNDFSKNVIIMGPFVRSCLFNSTNDKSAKIRDELYFFKYDEDKWDDIIDLSIFTEKKTEYVYQDDERKISLVKKKYKSPAHIIIQHDYLKRVGWCGGSFYASSMFLIEIQKHLDLIDSKFRDPILNIPYDPLEVYQPCEKDKTHPIKIIDMINYRELLQLSKKNLTKLFNSKTCVELCLDKLVKENHPMLLNQLKQMILYLACVSYKRPPFIYAKMLEIDKKFPEIYKILKNFTNEYKITDIHHIPQSINEINNDILELLIAKNAPDEFFDYLTFSKHKIEKILIDMVIKYGSDKIAMTIINNKLIDKYLAYYLIFMSENIELTKSLDHSVDLDLATNYLKDILENGKIRSFYYLYDSDPSIITTLSNEGNNLLHQIKQNGKYEELIELIIKLNPDLVNLKNNNKETPIVYHAIHNPNLLTIFLDFEFDCTLVDTDGNTFLHHLSKHDYPDILKLSLKRCPELIDMPNKKSETPSIIACQAGNENGFYVLKGMGANLDTTDCYGNTPYHYICATSMCLGMIIKNSANFFGLTPLDYCKISDEYYGFC